MRRAPLPHDLAVAVALAGVDVTLPERDQEYPRRLTDRRGYLDGWHYDHAGVVRDAASGPG